MFNLLVINSAVYGIRGITRGIIKGANIQDRIVFISIFAYVIMLPGSIYFLSFEREFGINGIWYARIITETFVMFSYFMVICCVNWKKIDEFKIKHKFK